jgi:hypothetical protein
VTQFGEGQDEGQVIDVAADESGVEVVEELADAHRSRLH